MLAPLIGTHSCQQRITGLLLLTLFISTLPQLFAQHGELIEYCHTTTFNATCPRDKVVVMGTSLYGRMRIGACVSRDLGYLGCKDNVLNYMDLHCSGRHNCLVPVIDLDRIDTPDCTDEVTSHLEASYSCLDISFSSSHQCLPGGLVVVLPSSGYLGSISASELGQGTASCPWVIRPAAGQKVNLTLYNFARYTEQATVPGQSSDPCYELAVVSEGSARKSIVGCALDSRARVVHQSSSSEVRIYVQDPTTLAAQGIQFLLQYEVYGCPSLVVPPPTWFRSDGTTAVVKCNSTGDTWYLTCRGTEWVGHYGNCSSDSTNWGIGDMFNGGSVFPYGIVLIVAIGVALGVFFGGLLLFGVSLYLKRRHQREQRPPMSPRMEEGAIYDKTMASERERDYSMSHVCKSRETTLPRGAGHIPSSMDSQCSHDSETLRVGDQTGHYMPRDPRGMMGGVPHGYTRSAAAASAHLYECPQFK